MPKIDSKPPIDLNDQLYLSTNNGKHFLNLRNVNQILIGSNLATLAILAYTLWIAV